jgi:hypothetical protein
MPALDPQALEAQARYYCGDEERRARVREHATLNGIDYLEVADRDIVEVGGDEALRQRLLAVHFLKGDLPALTEEHVVIEGGVRVAPVSVLWARPLPEVSATPDALVPAAEKALVAALFAGEPEPERVLVVRTDARGDYSSYRLVVAPPPASDIDPRLSAVDFSFKVECPSDFDCKNEQPCPPEEAPGPAIDYLAKDYKSFRRLLFDRLSVLAPEWRERNPADLGVTLVELMAYVGDQLSYAQDAATTEQYLGTARQRVSVRRHARLVDYFLHEGHNARAWVAFEVTAPVTLQRPDPQAGIAGHPILTRGTADGEPGTGAMIPAHELDAMVDAGAVVFEPMHDLDAHPDLNEIALYAWSDRECCLPAGATRATLVGPLPEDELAPGRLLAFEEMVGPQSGAVADADPAKRWVVRLTAVAHGVTDPLDGTDLVEVAWSAADAPPFPLCLSARTDEEHGARYIEGVTVARANVLLADHGRTVAGETLAPVPAAGVGEGEAAGPFRPLLPQPAITFASPLPEDLRGQPPAFDPGEPPVLTPAARAFDADPATAAPAVRLTSAGEAWLPRRDLLASGPFETSFVVEVDDERRARLRFGDGLHGRRPPAGTLFTTAYRVGSAAAGGGNVGAESLALVAGAAGVTRVRNLLPAAGGQGPEPVEEARRYAPVAFRTQERAVTAEDYARAAERHPEVDRAAASFRWTGSWYTVFVTADRRGGLDVDAAFERDLRRHLERFRMAGYDLEIDGPRPVSLDLALFVCVAAGYERSAVAREVLATLSNRPLPGGRCGLFHPDAWTFGQPVYLSAILAAVRALDGVASVTAQRFQRWGRAADGELESGMLPVGRLEIARLDNDPSLPENGRLELALEVVG